MPTNEERREAARRLRNFEFEALEVLDTLDTDSNAVFILYTLALIVCGDVEVTGYELANRLANLIEPEPERVCRDFGGEEGTNGEQHEFACSACGYMGSILQPNYCPYCGAKVANDEGF